MQHTGDNEAMNSEFLDIGKEYKPKLTKRRKAIQKRPKHVWATAKGLQDTSFTLSHPNECSMQMHAKSSTKSSAGLRVSGARRIHTRTADPFWGGERSEDLPSNARLRLK